MEHSQHNINLAKERDPAQNKVDVEGGMDYKPRALVPTQGREKGKANDRQRIHTKPMDSQIGTPTQGAKKGVKAKKSRDSVTTGPPPQAEAYSVATCSKQTGPQPYQKDSTSYCPDDTHTNGATDPTERDETHPPVKTVETLYSLHQAETELMEPPSGYEGLCPHESPGESKCLNKKAGRKDSGCVPIQHPSQSGQMDRIAVTGTEPPQAHPTTPKNEREQLPGPTVQGQDGPRPDPQPAITGTAELTLTASPGPGKRRKEKPEEKGNTHNTVMSTLLTAALPEALEHVPIETKDNKLVPTLTQAKTNSIEKRRRRQSRAQQAKKSTACFHLGTPILVRKPEGATWTPIYKAVKGDIVVQSLPSGKIEDLT